MRFKVNLCNLNASSGNQPPVISMDELLKITWRRNNFKDVCQQFVFFFLRICGYKVCYIIIIGSDREFKIVSKLLNANYVQIFHIIYLSKFKHNSNTWINCIRFKKSTHHYAALKYFVCSYSDQNTIKVVRPQGNKILL